MNTIATFFTMRCIQRNGQLLRRGPLDGASIRPCGRQDSPGASPGSMLQSGDRNAGKPLLVASLLLIASCRSSTPSTLHFVIPDGFRGAFSVGWDGSASAPPREAERLILRIPEDGDLLIPDTSPLASWHTTSAATHSGRSLPVQAGQGDPAVFYIHAHANGTHWFFVGSEAAYDEVLRDPFAISRGHVVR